MCAIVVVSIFNQHKILRGLESEVSTKVERGETRLKFLSVGHFKSLATILLKHWD